MQENAGPVDRGWIKLVEAARIIGVYPGTLYRWWRYGQLPEAVCLKVDNTLYFNRGELGHIQKGAQSDVGATPQVPTKGENS